MRDLLALIRKHESQDDYNAISFYVPATQRPGNPLSTLTIGQVLAALQTIYYRLASIWGPE